MVRHEPTRSVRYCDRAARRVPFEQSLVGDQHAPGGAHNRIQTEKRLVWQACEREGSLSEVPAGRAPCGGEVLPQRHIDRLLKHIQDRGNQRRNQDDPEHRQGPEPGRRQHRPAQQQQECQRRGRDCAAGCRRSSSGTASRAGFSRRRASGPGTPGITHCAICQSPRIHRCRRFTSSL